MLGNERGKRLYQYVPDYVVFDLETTGTSVYSDKVIEISAVKVNNGNVVDEFTSLVNPQCRIPYQASRVNGITDDMVWNAPTFDKVLEDFLAFIGENILVGHNIHTFDMKFIYRDCEIFFGKVPSNDYVDTLSFARNSLPELSHHRLTDLAVYYKISTDGAHRALNDCRMNQQVFEHLGAAQKTEQEKNCPLCGNTLKKRNGRYGEFWGCNGFPACRYTENA